MSMTGQFALYAVGLLILLLVAMFCIAGVIAVYEDTISRKIRYGVEFNRMVAEERALRKKQNSELRARIHKLEDAVRELNPGLNI